MLAFKIPQASRAQRPVFLTRNPFNNTFKRNYEGDYNCPDEEVRRMLADANLNFRPDSRILEGYSMMILIFKVFANIASFLHQITPAIHG